MIDFFKRIRIRAKLLLAFGSIILLSVFLTVYAFNSSVRIIAMQKLNEESEKLLINLGQIELAAKEFIYEGYKTKSFQENDKSEILDRYELALTGANENLKFISEDTYLKDEEIKSVVKSLFESTAISDNFRDTRSLLKKRGFKDYGLEGLLRAAIHQIESSTLPYDRVAMLTLRRHEKDFFLRKDLKYQNDFNSTISSFSESLKEAKNEELLALLSNYQKEFNQVVGIEKEIGLTDKDGKKGQLFSQMQKVRAAVESVQQKVHEISDEQIMQARIWLSAIFLIQFCVAIILAYAYSGALTNVIKEIKVTMSHLAEGIFPSPLKVQSEEEIGQTKVAINQFLERLKSATSFAEKLGSGKLHTDYEERFRGDVFAKSLINMQTKLTEAEAVQSKINWNNEGLARFNEVLKNDAEDLRVLGDKILSSLVHILRANQAAFYIVNREEKCLERIATYAYDKKRFRDEKVDLEAGLTGQCIKEKETIYLKEIPSDYVKITSGLGEATPRNVVIVPLKVRGEVNGVMEIASFSLFEPHHISFAEKIAELVASIIAGRQNSIQTKRLLEESKTKAEGLSLQEEELRQTAEELQATQEELNRQRNEMAMEIKRLKERLKRYEGESVTIQN